MLTLSDIDRLVEKARQPIGGLWFASDDMHIGELLAEYGSQVSVRLIYYRFLYWLMMERKPQVAIELGVETGLASAHMLAAARTYGGKVVGVDLNWHPLPGEFARLYKGNYDFIVADTLSAFSFIRELYGMTVGVVFQDSSHHYNESIAEWDLYNQLMTENAIWICDDVSPSFHDPKVDPPGKGMVEYFHSRPGHKKLYKNLYEEGVENAVGVIIR